MDISRFPKGGVATVDGEEGRRREVKYEWKMHDGTPCHMTLFDVTTLEADESAKACGWPGHSGGG
jgi:hypothetical protein